MSALVKHFAIAELLMCMCVVAVYLDRVHRPGNKAVLVHCIELPEFTKARMYISS